MKRQVPLAAFHVFPKLVVAVVLSATLGFAATPSSSTIHLTTWAPYFRAEPSLEAIQRWGRQFSEISVFAVQFDLKHRLVPPGPFIGQAIEEIRHRSPETRLTLTVVNDVGEQEKDSQILQELLSDRSARRRHVKELVKLSGNVDGIDIDYEKIAKEQGADFTAFVQELAKALHGHHKTLSVVVEPKTTDAMKPVDWKAIGEAADRVRVMAYNYVWETTPPGAVSPPDRVLPLTEFAASRIPLPKLEIALPLHGYDWPEGGKGRQINALSDIVALAQSKNAEIQRDPATGAPHFSYRDDAGIQHQVWYEDPESIGQKARLLQDRGVRFIGVWEIGSGDLTALFPAAGVHFLPQP